MIVQASEVPTDPADETSKPASFTDASGQRWVVDVNVTTIREVKKALDFDLLDAIGKPEVFHRFYTDPFLLCDLLWVLCKSQAAELGVDDAEFGRRLHGDGLERGTDALVAGLASFFPNRRRRELVLREAARIRSMEARALDLIDVQVEAKGKKLESEIEQRVAAFGARSTSWPESSGAIPAPIPSAS